MLIGKISKCIGYFSEDGQCMLYSGLSYLNWELSLEDMAFKWNVLALTF